MKQKNILAFAVTVASTLAFTLLARDGHSSKGSGVFLLKSHGETIAELRVLPGTQCNVESLGPNGSAEYNTTAGAWHVTKGGVLKVVSGTNSITVTADEIEGRPADK